MNPLFSLPRVRFSLRYKFLFVMGLLLVAAVAFYTLLASSIFRQEKTALLYDINHSTAVNTAAQLRSSFAQTASQLQLYTLSSATDSRSTLRLGPNFLRDAGVVSAEVFLKKGSNFQAFKDPARGLSSEWSKQIEASHPSPYAFWSTNENGIVKFYFSARWEQKPTSEEGTKLVIAEMDPSIYFRTLQSASLFHTFLVDGNGSILLHCDRAKQIRLGQGALHPLSEEMRTRLSSEARSGVTSYQTGEEEWYGAYAPIGVGGLYLISQASKAEVTSALDLLIQRSLLFGLIAVTATFLASILFSKRLTRNLHKLTVMAQKIGKGDLRSKIRIRSFDEVENLAASFNAMIDELRQSQEAIEKYNRELEQKVAERTQELKEKNVAIEEIQHKLLESTQLAAAGEVAGRTAHEVLNPLTSIVGRLEKVRAYATVDAKPSEQLLQILGAWEEEYKKGGWTKLEENLRSPSTIDPRQSLFEEDLQNLKTLAQHWSGQQQQLGGDLGFVRDQANRIQRIVDGMREMVRSSTVTEEISCHQTVQEAALTLSDILEKHRIHLAKEFEAPYDRAVLNKDELIQVLTNLLRNAFQAIQSRQVREPQLQGHIVIRTLEVDGGMAIEIHDNGVGIEPEQQERVFDQGFTTKPPSQGTGLGLAICRRYARAFGGEVTLVASDTKGNGTCFRVFVPLLINRHTLKVAV